MGKRGPKPGSKFASSGATLSARITVATRDRLDKAAKANKLSISKELERRLVRSFDNDAPETIKSFGSPETYALLRLAAEGIKSMEESSGQPWYQDRFTFNLVAGLVRELLEAFTPPGDGSPPSTFPAWVEESPFPLDDQIRQAIRSAAATAPKTLISHPVFVRMMHSLSFAEGTATEDMKVYRAAADYLTHRLADHIRLAAEQVAVDRKKGSRK